MAYASLAHVLAYNPQRGSYGATSRPTATQAQYLLNAAEAEVISLLAKAGYADPIPTSATSAWLTVQDAIVICAAAKIEEAAPASDRREQYRRMCQAAKNALLNGQLPGVDKDPSHLPRYDAGATPPLFTRTMDL